MTTVAYCDGIMAADTASFINDGNVRLPGRTAKIQRLSSGALMARSGVISNVQELRDWLDAPEPQGPHPAADDVTVIVVYPKAPTEIHIYEGKFHRTATAALWAIGSGAEAALGAMYAGATAEEAVRVAMLIDPWTAGDVDVHYLDPNAPQRLAEAARMRAYGPPSAPAPAAEPPQDQYQPAKPAVQPSDAKTWPKAPWDDLDYRNIHMGGPR